MVAENSKQVKGVMPDPLPKLTFFGYGVGHLLNDLCSALWFTYSLIFYSQVIGFSSLCSGIIVFIGQLADALATPAIGVWSDRSSFLCLGFIGKRKSWYAMGTLMVMLSMPFMYSPCINCEHTTTNLKLGYYAIFVVVFQIGWAAVQTVHLALVTDLTFISNERTSLLSLRNTFTVVSNIAVYLVAFAVLIKSPSTDHKFHRKDVGLFQIITAAIVGIGAISSLFFAFAVKEARLEPLLEEPSTDRHSSTRGPHTNSYSSWLKKLLLYHVALVYMFTRIFCNVVQSFISLYLNQSLHLNKFTLALIPLVMYIAGFVSSILSGLISKLLGKKLTYIFGALFGIGACTWMELDSSGLYKTYFVYIVAVLFGVASSIMLVVVLAVTSDLIGSDTGNSAFVYGLMSFVDKLSCGIVILLIQTFAVADDITYYTHTLVFTCGTACVLGALLVSFLPYALVQDQIYRDDSPETAAVPVQPPEVYTPASTTLRRTADRSPAKIE